MYEMEGASQPSGANGPIARPAKPRSTPPSPGKASTNPGRLGARLPERRLSRTARQLGKPYRELWAPVTRSRELPVLVLADPEVSLRAGSPSLAT
jgi:nucleoid-associated protein YgaU